MRFTTATLATFSSLLALVSSNAIRFYTTKGSCGSAYSGCENIGANVCCTTSSAKWSVSISKAPLDVAVGWFEDNSLDCGESYCTAGGSGTLCCISSGVVPGYTGGSFYTISGKMRRDTAEKCTTTQEANVFGVAVADGQFLQISHAEVKGKSTFDALHAAFQEVAEGDAKTWLEKNGAVVVTDKVVTQTVQAVSQS
jgi:hypothetical protein